MIDLSIHPELKKAAPDLTVGVLTANVTGTEFDQALWDEIQDQAARISGLTIKTVRGFAPIKALRDTYKALGNDPKRHRPATEAIYHRIVKGKGLYQINTVVDVGNLVSLESTCSCGVIDLDHLSPPVVFRIGQADESYRAIGRGEIKLANIPVFADSVGPFASTTSDSQRTMVELETARGMLLIISFAGNARVSEALDRGRELFQRYAQASGVDTRMVQ